MKNVRMSFGNRKPIHRHDLCLGSEMRRDDVWVKADF